MSEGRNAFDDAVRLLARRSHNRSELVAKLKRRGHEAPMIEAAFARLQALGYLEEEDALAVRYARELAAKRGATPRSVERKLRGRGFQEDEAAQAVSAVFQGWDPRVAALETVEGESDPERAARKLSRRGFPADAIAWVVDRLRRDPS